MAGFAELLRKTASSALNEKSAHYVSMILESASRMGSLIDDLLAFSRISRAEAHHSIVSLEQLVREAVAERHEGFRVIRCLTGKAGHEFIPYEGIYAATHFGALAVRMATITGSRPGEVQQNCAIWRLHQETVERGSQGGNTVAFAYGAERPKGPGGLLHRRGHQKTFC
jgi:signal transduction histidine kinase